MVWFGQPEQIQQTGKLASLILSEDVIMFPVMARRISLHHLGTGIMILLFALVNRRSREQHAFYGPTAVN